MPLPHRLTGPTGLVGQPWPGVLRALIERHRLLARYTEFAASRTGRLLLGLGYLAGGILFLFAFPDTPDEIARIADVRDVLQGEPYSFFWPAGNILMIVANPLFYSDIIGDLHAVRLLNFLISAIPVLYLIAQCRERALLGVLPALFPYAWLINATASQQGLMLALLICILWSAVERRVGAVFLASAALYLVNPAMLVVVPFALAAVALGGRTRPVASVMAAAGYLPLALLALGIWVATGAFVPTLSENGALNLWLGNNPHPLSHRGFGEAGENADTLAGVMDFLDADPAGFAANLLRKATLYWAPWDYLRSGMGGALQPLVFSYIAVAQVIIYVAFWRMRRTARAEAWLIALALAVLAWGLYSAFFVKIRFRVPFDLVLFAACMVPALSGRQTRPGRGD